MRLPWDTARLVIENTISAYNWVAAGLDRDAKECVADDVIFFNDSLTLIVDEYPVILPFVNAIPAYGCPRTVVDRNAGSALAHDVALANN